MKIPFAWISVNEAIDEDGFYLEDSPKLRELERQELAEMGAPDTAEIEFISILPENRDEAMVEALVTPGFAEWARSREGEAKTEPVDNGESNLVYYNEDLEWGNEDHAEAWQAIVDEIVAKETK